MKKYILSTLVIVIITLIIYSCNDENQSINNSPIFNKNLNNLTYGNKTYQFNDKGDVSIFNANNKFEFHFSLADGNKGVISNKTNLNYKSGQSIRFLNEKTNEYIDIINISENENYITFDFETNNGEKFNNLQLNINEDFSKKAPCVWCGAVVVALVKIAADAIADAIIDSPLEQCTNSMKALNCSQGKDPYMEFSEGWFSTTCNVGCR